MLPGMSRSRGSELPAASTASARVAIGRCHRRRLWVRLLVVLIILPTAQVGFWAALAPESFVSDFPGWGMHWTAATDRFDEHFVRDVGFLHLALLAAAVYTFVRPWHGRMLGLAWAVFAVPHLWFHAGHRTGLSDWAAVSSLAMLALSAGVGVALLLLAPPADEGRVVFAEGRGRSGVKR